MKDKANGFCSWTCESSNHIQTQSMIESEIFRFKAFFTGHFNAVVRFVTTFTGDTDEAQDIA